MIGDLFDSPWKVLIVAVVLIVLFGSKKLPDAARSLGKSMRILKAEVSTLHQDELDPKASPAQAQAPQAPEVNQAPATSETSFPQVQLAATAPQGDPQSQIDALQQQVRDLQRAAAMDGPARTTVASEPPQPS
jgi:sec-independent protein translocase protein TatA